MKITSQLIVSSCLKSTIGITTLLAACVIASADALAGPEGHVPVARSAKVSIAGVDLSMPLGESTARERVRQTARKLCAQVADELDLSHHANYLACVEDSVAKAMQRVSPSSIVAGAAVTPAPKSRP